MKDGTSPKNVAEAGASPPGRTWLPRLFLWGTFGFTAVFSILLHRFNAALQDEGVQAMGAWRVALGQVPLRDYYEIIPPLSLYPSAWLVAWWGPVVEAVRLPALALALAMVWAVDRALVELEADGWVRAAAAAFLSSHGVSFWPMPSHHWYATLFQVLAIALLLRALRSDFPWRWAAAAGCATAFSAFSMQDQGGYFTLAYPLLAVPFIPSGRRLKLLAGWVGGGVATGAALGFAFFRSVPLKLLWEQLVLFPLFQYRQHPGNRLGFGASLADALQPMLLGWKVSPLYSGILTLNRLMMVALPLLAVAALLAILIRNRERRPAAAVLAVGVLAGLGGVLHRWGISNLTWAGPLLVAPVLFAFSLGRRATRPALRRLATGGVLAVWALSVGLSVFLLLFAFRPGVATVRTPAGTLRSLHPEKAASIQGFVDAIAVAVPPGEPMFVRGFNPHISYLTQHPNPTPYNFFVHPRYHSDAQAAEVVAVLEEKRVRWVATNQGSEGPSALDDYLQGKYHWVWYNRDYGILERNPEVGGTSDPSAQPAQR